MKIATVGIDLVKNVFQVHGIDERGKVVLKKQLRRDQMAAFFGIGCGKGLCGHARRRQTRYVDCSGRSVSSFRRALATLPRAFPS